MSATRQLIWPPPANLSYPPSLPASGDHIDLTALREPSRAARVDPDLVGQGYRDMRDGLVTIDKVAARLRAFSHG